jgi:hypothetical protein
MMQAGRNAYSKDLDFASYAAEIPRFFLDQCK